MHNGDTFHLKQGGREEKVSKRPKVIHHRSVGVSWYTFIHLDYYKAIIRNFNFGLGNGINSKKRELKFKRQCTMEAALGSPAALVAICGEHCCLPNNFGDNLNLRSSSLTAVARCVLSSGLLVLWDGNYSLANRTGEEHRTCRTFLLNDIAG